MWNTRRPLTADGSRGKMADKPNTRPQSVEALKQHLFKHLVRLKWPMAPDLPERAKPAAPVAKALPTGSARGCR